MMLPKSLREAATAAFRDNAKLKEMSATDREQVAQWYEELAGLAVMDDTATAHVFREGERVTLNANATFMDLKGSDIGIIGVLYDTQPPSYEVTWVPKDPEAGAAFDATMYEHEVAAAPAALQQQKAL